MCPLMSMRMAISESVMDGWVNCQMRSCKIWDVERNCCSFNTKTLVVNQYESAAVSRVKDRLKVEILGMLEQKTGWGRVELKKALFDLIDGLQDESSL